MGDPTQHDDAQTASLLEEQLKVSKREVVQDIVRVTTKTETSTEIIETALARDNVDVVRVAIDRVVAEPPPVRTEGDTTIVPVLKERLVVTKQLVLVEEPHIRKKVEHEVISTPVALRHQRAIIERIDGDPSEAGDA